MTRNYATPNNGLRWLRWVVSLSAAVALGCSGADVATLSGANVVEKRSAKLATSAPPDQPFWVPGEQMAWELSVRGIVGASVVLGVGKPGTVDGREILIVRSQIKGLGLVRLLLDLSEDVTTWVSCATSRFVYRRAQEKKDGQRLVQEVRVDASGFDVLRRTADGEPTNQRRKVPNGGLLVDVNSMLGVMRAWQPAPGTHTRVYFWHDSKVREHTLRMTGKETIKTRMGTFSAYRIDGRADRNGTKPRYYSVWISDDAKRMPVLVKADTKVGTGKIELASYTVPDDDL